VPEPLELLFRRLEWSGMAVPEADDGDPCDEVEVALPVVRDQPAAVAVDERHREAGVRREKGSSGQHAHDTPPCSGAGQAGASVWDAVHP